MKTLRMAQSVYGQYILVPVELAAQIGNDAAILITRIQYWLSVCGKQVEGGLWIYNSLDQWKRQLPNFTLYKIRKSISSLEKMGLLISRKVNASKTRSHEMVHY